MKTSCFFPFCRRNALTPLAVVSITALLVMCQISTLAAEEAGSALLGRYTCSQVKELAMSKPQELFAMWAEEKILGDGTGVADELAKRGNINLALSKIGDLTTVIQGLEEAARGDSKNALEILGGWAFWKVMEELELAEMLGVPGAVWTVCKELNQFAIDLNEEILDINIRTFADFAQRDPRLLEKHGETYFLKTYLDSDLTQPDTYDMIKRRAALMEYAKVKLGIKNFPGVREWPQHWNSVRSVARSMLNEVEAEVEKRRKFEQLQGELRAQLTELKSELTVLTAFQGLLGQALAMTCQEPASDCGDVYIGILQLLERLILDAGDINVAGAGVFDDLSGSIEGINGELDSLFQEINQSKSRIEAYCAQGDEAFQAAAETIALAETATADAAAQAARAEKHRQAACSAATADQAEEAVVMARDAVEVATRVAGSLSFLDGELEKQKPPAAVDFSAVEAEIADLESRLKALDETVQKNLRQKERLTADVAAARTKASALGDQCPDVKKMGLVAQTMARLDEVLAAVPDVRADADALAGIQGQAARLNKRVAGLKNTQTKDRACLQTVPDVGAYQSRVRQMIGDARGSLDTTIGHAEAAMECYQRLKNKCKANERQDDQGNCVCIKGYERVDGRCLPVCKKNQARGPNGECQAVRRTGCGSDADCPQGYICDSDTGRCVSPFDDSYDDYAGTRGQREDDRNQDQADRIAADQAAGSGWGADSDDLDRDLDTLQDGLAGGCGDDTQCPAGHVCRNGRCVETSSCADDSQCPTGKVCRDGECVKGPACATSDDCPAGNVCRDGACVPEAECAGPGDCPSGYACQKGKCVKQPECKKNKDCPGDKICQNGVCVDKPPTQTSTAPAPRPTPTPKPSPSPIPTVTPKYRDLMWHASQVCGENEGDEYHWRWMVSLRQSGIKVTGDLYFHQCPGGGRVSYRVSGEEKPDGIFEVSGEKSGGRGALHGSASWKETFTLREGKVPSPAY